MSSRATTAEDRFGANQRAGLERLRDASPVRQDTMLRLVARRFLRHRMATAGLVVLVMLVLSAILAELAPHDPNALAATARKQGPSVDHWFGTDKVGRDIFARTLYGGRISLVIGLAATGVALAIGTVVGALAGYFGGKTDAALMRLTDVFLCFPQLFVLIVLGTLIRTTSLRVLQGSIAPIAVVIGVLSWMGLARIVRATVLSLREREFVEAARAIGASPRTILFRHILPNSIAPIIVAVSVNFGNAILAESALSYLGVGVQPPTPSWGQMINANLDQWRYYPHLVLAPGGVLALLILGFNFFGDGVADALNPRQSRR